MRTTESKCFLSVFREKVGVGKGLGLMEQAEHVWIFAFHGFFDVEFLL